MPKHLFPCSRIHKWSRAQHTNTHTNSQFNKENACISFIYACKTHNTRHEMRYAFLLGEPIMVIFINAISYFYCLNFGSRLLLWWCHVLKSLCWTRALFAGLAWCIDALVPFTIFVCRWHVCDYVLEGHTRNLKHWMEFHFSNI